MRTLQDQRGMTLIETILAVAITVLVITSTMSVLMAGEHTANAILIWSDRAQVLQAAVDQINQDQALGQITSASGPLRVDTLVVTTLVPFNSKTVIGVPNWPSSGDYADWPGYLTSWSRRAVEVHFQFEGSTLVREIQWRPTPAQTQTVLVSRQVLATQLVPFDGTEAGSFFLVGSDNWVTVRLASKAPGGNKDVQTRVRFKIRSAP